VTVPVGFGDNALTVSATASGNRTGYAQTTVAGTQIVGTSLLDVTDPAGDDNGPGTFQYPTASDFIPGAFDITRFRVISSGTTVYLQATLANLDPTFGTPLGAQLLDVYVHTAGTAATSTAAAFPSRNYTIAPGDAWSQRIEVQGFAAPVWVDAAGNSRGTPVLAASSTSKTVTIAVPQSAFGTPASGWSFSVVLTGQDGFSSDQARAFAPTPQPFNFGVCAAGGSSPICATDPNTVPKAMDIIATTANPQATELDPTLGPVVVHGVPIS
jgi:glucoamylase